MGREPCAGCIGSYGRERFARIASERLAGGSGLDSFDALPWEEGAFKTREYRNLFAEVGYKQDDIDAKLKEVFDGVFYGPDKVYFEVGDSMAYISDIKNHDVRTKACPTG